MTADDYAPNDLAHVRLLRELVELDNTALDPRAAAEAVRTHALASIALELRALREHVEDDGDGAARTRSSDAAARIVRGLLYNDEDRPREDIEAEATRFLSTGHA